MLIVKWGFRDSQNVFEPSDIIPICREALTTSLTKGQTSSLAQAAGLLWPLVCHVSPLKPSRNFSSRSEQDAQSYSIDVSPSLGSRESTNVQQPPPTVMLDNFASPSKRLETMPGYE